MWFDRFNKTFVRFGYKQSNEENTMFIKHHQGKTIILTVYVGDAVVTRNDYEEFYMLKKNLVKEFEIKDLRRLHCFLGIEAARSSKCIFIF